MFCPVCSQEQISEQTRFCSRCGFLLAGVSQLIANGGAPIMPQQMDAANFNPHAMSPRKRGAKQGTLLIFSGLIIVPLLLLFSIALQLGPFPSMVVAILLFGGGVLRLIFALLFESGYPGAPPSESVLPQALRDVLPSQKKSQALPPQQTAPASSYAPPTAGNWRDTNDLAAAPPSVTESTTKLLTKEE